MIKQLWSKGSGMSCTRTLEPLQNCVSHLYGPIVRNSSADPSRPEGALVREDGFWGQNGVVQYPLEGTWTLWAHGSKEGFLSRRAPAPTATTRTTISYPDSSFRGPLLRPRSEFTLLRASISAPTSRLEVQELGRPPLGAGKEREVAKSWNRALQTGSVYAGREGFVKRIRTPLVEGKAKGNQPFWRSPM